MKHSIAIFASGSGSNAEKIINHFRKSNSAEIKLIISNKNDALVIERARKLQVPYVIFTRKSDFSGDVLFKLLLDNNIDLIVLAGFLWLLPANLIEKFPNRIINIHPALLPRYGGKGMYGARVHQAVSESGDTESGITIHYVNEHYDEGDIIFQASCSIRAGENPESIAHKVHQLEYEYYPKVIEEVLNKFQSNL
jgi:phosphoribosylglycinamide formyltransferase-1